MAIDSAKRRMSELGIILPATSQPTAQNTNCVKAGSPLFIAEKEPFGQNGAKPRGKPGSELTTQEGYQFARQVGLEILAVLRTYLGTLNRIKRVVKRQGFVNAAAELEARQKDFDGRSGLMLEIFGERGQRARSVTGAPSLRDNLPIVVDSIFELEPE